MKSFTSIVAISAAVVGLVAASPAVETRSSCKENQFFYSKLSCCLDHGGPPSPPTPPRSRDCPQNNWYWNNKQGCCTPKHENPPEPSCKKGYSWSSGSWCCEENPTPSTSSHAQPSQTPGGNGGYGNGGGNGGYGNGNGNGHGGYGNGNGNGNGGHYGGHKKRSNLSRNIALCPTGLNACPVASKMGYNRPSDYECVDPLEDLNSCGGCASTGEGQNCAAIANTRSVGCVSGGCQVYTCAPGYDVSFDQKTCIQL